MQESQGEVILKLFVAKFIACFMYGGLALNETPSAFIKRKEQGVKRQPQSFVRYRRNTRPFFLISFSCNADEILEPGINLIRRGRTNHLAQQPKTTLP